MDIFGEVDNIFDPANPNYSDPQTTIVTGPGNNQVLDTTLVIFQWRHADPAYWVDSTGDYQIASEILYSYRLNFGAWSPWTSGQYLLTNPYPIWSFDVTTGLHTLRIEGLEDRDYTFEVRSMYPTNIQEENWPTRRFVVDAMEGPAVIMSPAVIYADSGATFIMAVKVIEAVDLMGIHVKVAYSPDFLVIRDYMIRSDSTDFLLQSQAQFIEEFTFIDHDSTTGIFDLNIGLAGGTVTGVSGSGVVVRFLFSHIGPRGESTIEILPESSLRNVYNEPTLNLTRNGRVVVW
jgi:hypothetical protein